MPLFHSSQLSRRDSSNCGLVTKYTVPTQSMSSAYSIKEFHWSSIVVSEMQWGGEDLSISLSWGVFVDGVRCRGLGGKGGLRRGGPLIYRGVCGGGLRGCGSRDPCTRTIGGLVSPLTQLQSPPTTTPRTCRGCIMSHSGQHAHPLLLREKTVLCKFAMHD